MAASTTNPQHFAFLLECQAPSPNELLLVHGCCGTTSKIPFLQIEAIAATARLKAFIFFQNLLLSRKHLGLFPLQEQLRLISDDMKDAGCPGSVSCLRFLLRLFLCDLERRAMS